MLGYDLWHLQHKMTLNRRLPVQWSVPLMRQSVKALRDLHSKGYVHGDVSLGNFMLGKDERRNVVHLVDYGFTYPTDMCRIWKPDGLFIGTVRYASPNAHKEPGTYLSMRDDLFSLYYCFCEMTRGELPWQKFENEPGLSNLELRRKVGQMKLTREYSVENLSKWLPPGMEIFAQHLTSLGPTDVPDYDLLDESLKLVLRNLHLDENMSFDSEITPSEKFVHWPM